MSGNRTSRTPWETKPVVTASTWGSSRPRVCSGICTEGAPTEPASGGSSSAPGLDNELIASTTTVLGTSPNVANASVACSSSTDKYGLRRHNGVIAGIGSGVMGEVYRAKDTKLGLASDLERVARFRGEAR